MGVRPCTPSFSQHKTHPGKVFSFTPLTQYIPAGRVGYLVSDTYRERQAQKQRDKIAAEVARGDEAAVNARLGRFRSLVPWVVAALLVIGGCAVTRTVYVKEQDRVTALRPGETYSNATEAVEWVVPRTVMTQLVIANEGLH